MDTQLPPFGEDARRQILTSICENGDAAETDFLEIKGPLDLTKPEGFSKVAKFLLGVSNRKPQDAARNFGGYAVLVIGAQKDAVPGVPAGTEPHQLRDRIEKYLGQGFPQFMFERLPADQNDREVLFVLAPPPTAGQPVFPCWTSYQSEAKDRRTKEKNNLRDGAVYIRDGSSCCGS
ncbi:hypothetical protein [Brachybacterium fresconis]|uniref:Schlafen AlbA-2 domain-containing protein n=1 Tax=Brachybacterium fresconis TaxID=173363 RepID=A0ABS4YQ88_9MICO|nr:hypothetical protein [Brachybacterium fresconis]MBP2410961.1 hypothetical protein [Brachybacterium fresconis]